ncbi:MAG: hypothetical protein M3285_12610 [Actinomycetota bacterium]|nr:hypothetical protein [Actinomycetota bacterium]
MIALRIKANVLDAARAFLEGVGARGREGTTFLAGPIIDDVAEAHEFVLPDQVAGTYPDCWVEVTPEGKLQLAASLRNDWRYVARLHSHPGEAFHSHTDDRNPGLTAEGSFSIVVPFFGLGLRRGLEACAVLVRRNGDWVPLSEHETSQMVAVE